MAALSSLPHRHGMIYQEQDDTSSGEFPAGGALGSTRPSSDTSSPAQRSRTAGSEDSYEEIYTSSSEEESYHSDCDDIAEYWDPYCKHGM